MTIYRIARKFHGIKFSWKLIRLSFRNFIFMDSDPIAIINDINTVLRIKIFHGRGQIRENHENFNLQNFTYGIPRKSLRLTVFY